MVRPGSHCNAEPTGHVAARARCTYLAFLPSFLLVFFTTLVWCLLLPLPVFFATLHGVFYYPSMVFFTTLPGVFRYHKIVFLTTMCFSDNYRVAKNTTFRKLMVFFATLMVSFATLMVLFAPLMVFFATLMVLFATLMCSLLNSLQRLSAICSWRKSSTFTPAEFLRNDRTA